MVTDTGKRGVTFITITFDVSGLPAVQVSLEINRQDMASWSSGIRLKVLPVAPGTTVSLSSHWKAGLFPPLVAVAEKTTSSPWQAKSP